MALVRNRVGTHVMPLAHTQLQLQLLQEAKLCFQPIFCLQHLAYAFTHHLYQHYM